VGLKSFGTQSLQQLQERCHSAHLVCQMEKTAVKMTSGSLATRPEKSAATFAGGPFIGQVDYFGVARHSGRS
jgi:hypothetical protein